MKSLSFICQKICRNSAAAVKTAFSKAKLFVLMPNMSLRFGAMLDCDLLVFNSPVYALRTTAQMKCLLDHLCVHWMVHRPDERMFNKKAVIITNAIGVFNGGAQKDIATSLMWLGVSDIKKLGIGLRRCILGRTFR